MIFVAFLIVFALVFASFLNVVITRTDAAGTFDWRRFSGRSRCPKCKKQIAWFDNIPVLSFFILGGKCRKCGKKISWQYPLVEVLFTLAMLGLVLEKGLFNELNLFVDFSADFASALAAVWPAFILLIFYFLILGALFAIFVYDLKTSLIPDEFVLAGALAAFLLNLFNDWTQFDGFGLKAAETSEKLVFFNFFNAGFLETQTFSGLLGAALASGFFFLLVWGSGEKWMGWGDVKFAIFMGLILGFPVVLVGLFIAFFLGSIVGIALILKNRKNLKSAIPFGPFLCLGTYLALLFGQEIVSWYLALIV